MTGREHQTLDAFVQFATAAFERLESKVDTIDERVRGLEQVEARQEGAHEAAAAAVAHANVVNQRIESVKASRRDSLRTIFAVAAGAATVAGVIVGLVFQFYR